MAITICLLYGSLLIELVLFHVPSVANTHVFFTKEGSIINGYKKYQYVFSWSKQKKFWLLTLPHILNVFAFFLPLLLVFFAKGNWSIFATMGLLVALFGRIISFFSMLVIRKKNSQKEGYFTLHSTGIFSFSRNPIQMGMYFLYVGICLVNFHWILIFSFLFYFFYNNFRIKIEEDFLEMKFKGLYLNYKLKTRRYL